VRDRFDFISVGKLLVRPSGWPELWVFELGEAAVIDPP
jgi:hypothetical protein